MKLFDFSLKINGFPIAQAKLDLNQICNLSEAKHIEFIENQKKAIVDFHLKNNSFYRNIVDKSWNGTWQNLPVLTKKNLQQPLENRLTSGFSKSNIYINKTSGSSGDPFVFAKCKYSHAMTWASNVYRFGWYGIDFNKSKQARFYGIPLDFFAYYKERFKDFLLNRFRFSVFDLSDAKLEKVLSKFSSVKFDYINGYTSSIVLFAKFLKQKNIVLINVCPTLKLCVVTSEMLFDDDKVLLETQFGIPVVNEYGASELDLIAFENPTGDWQINAETLFVEILDDQNNVLPYGKCGRVVITSLFNKAHPFIRYDIGDIGILDEKSTIQEPILKKLEGRTNDIAILPSGKKAAGLTFYYITKTIIENDGNIKEFIIKQTKIDSFEVEYVSNKKLSELQIIEIQKAIDLYLEPNLQFSFYQKSILARSNRGKLKQFSSLVP